MDDTEIYRLLRTRPEEGMCELIGQYHALVFTVCSNILRGYPQDAEECVSESFVQMWRTVKRLKKPSQLRAYLCCTARNIAISRYRSLKQTQKNLTDMPDENMQSDADVILMTERRMEKEKLESAILSLKEPDREIFVRKYYYMESVRSLAERFSLTEKAVESILYRSRRHLRRILKGETE